MALIAVDAHGENQIAVASGANAELGAEAVERAVRAARPAVVLLGHEVPEAVVLAGAAAAPGMLVLNPAPARRLPDALLARGPILTPNATEACELAGERDPETAARALAARTGAPVLATIGARGALLVHDGETETLPAPRVDVVDTTGAGDALNGALAAELAAGRPLRDAARFAVAAASLSTLRAGRPRRDAVPRRGRRGARRRDVRGRRRARRRDVRGHRRGRRRRVRGHRARTARAA